MKPEMLQQAIELYDRFTHEGMDRRDFFDRMTLIAGSAAAATEPDRRDRRLPRRSGYRSA